MKRLQTFFLGFCLLMFFSCTRNIVPVYDEEQLSHEQQLHKPPSFESLMEIAALRAHDTILWRKNQSFEVIMNSGVECTILDIYVGENTGNIYLPLKIDGEEGTYLEWGPIDLVDNIRDRLIVSPGKSRNIYHFDPEDLERFQLYCQRESYDNSQKKVMAREL